MNIRVTCADLTIFDETLVYGLEKEGQEIQIAIGTISFATNGTLFVNQEHNVYRLVNGAASLGIDIRPKKSSVDYYYLGSYYGIAVAPNGTLYVSINDGTTGFIYKVVNGKVFWETYVYRRSGQIKELAFHPDGELFYTDGLSIYSVAEGEVFTQESIWKEKITISSIAFAPDGNLFVSVRYDYPNYDLIVKRVDDRWRFVYVRPVRIDRWGIDNIAISPVGDIYFEDHDPYWGQLYKLVTRSQISLKNENLHLESIYPVISNSTVSDYSYRVSELRLNVTGLEGTKGAFILLVFRSNYPSGLEVQVEVNGSPKEFKMTESSVAYLISFTYSHQNTTALRIRLEGITLKYSGLDLFMIDLDIILIGIMLAIVVSLIVYRRKTRAKLAQP